MKKKRIGRRGVTELMKEQDVTKCPGVCVSLTPGSTVPKCLKIGARKCQTRSASWFLNLCVTMCLMRSVTMCPRRSVSRCPPSTVILSHIKCVTRSPGRDVLM